MESTKLLELIREKRIEELESQLLSIYNTENQNETNIENIEKDIIELRKQINSIKESIRESNNKYGNDKKNNDDIEKLNIILGYFKKKEGVETNIYIKTMQEIINDKLKEKDEKRQKNESIKEQVREEVQKINKEYRFSGTKKERMGTDYASLRIILRNENIINKDNTYNFEVIKEYCDCQEEINKIDRLIKLVEDNLVWIESNKELFSGKIEGYKIESIIKEKENIIKFLEEANKKIKEKNDEINRKNKEIQSIKKQIKASKSNNDSKKQTIKDKIKKLEEARTLTELNLGIEEVRKEVNDNSVDYLVIPISNDIKDIFSCKKKVNIQVDYNNLENEYNAETAVGTLNSDYNVLNEESAMLIPINYIQEKDIARVEADGRIVLNKINLPEGTKIISKNENESQNYKELETIYYNEKETTLKDKIRNTLGDNFTENKEEYKYYNIFKTKNKNTIIPDDIKKVVAVLETIYTNYFKTKDKKLIVDGKNVDLREKINIFLKNPEYKSVLVKELKNRGFSTEEKFLNSLNYLQKDNIRNEKTIEEIGNRIEEYINNPKENIDDIYKDLLKKYLTENERAKAFYNDEKYTQVNINRKRISIKPKLPQKDEELYKTLFRKGEDKIYKTMKTAALCNKLAHLYGYNAKRMSNAKNNNDGEVTDIQGRKQRKTLLKDKRNLLDKKTLLIKKVIEMSKGNKKVSLGKVADNRGEGIAMDIPGYATMVLHLPNNKTEIFKELNQYRYIGGKEQLFSKDDVINGVISSVIITYGVNRQLIEELKSIKRRERLGFLNSLNLRELQNILVRLGYTSKDFGTEKGKKRVLEEITSEEKLEELLEDDELCR